MQKVSRRVVEARNQINVFVLKKYSPPQDAMAEGTSKSQLLVTV